VTAIANKTASNNALLVVVPTRGNRYMNDLDPNRFALRQADQAREAYAQVMEELD
jgi:hypothetical protein